MPMKKKDDANDDAESVHSSTSSLNTSKQTTKRSRQSLGKGSSDQSKISPIDMAKEFNDTIRAYRNNNGRLICDCFIRLPTKRTNLDYYNTVKQPIDFLKIQQRLKTDEYETFQQFDEDITLLFSNAQQFYANDTIEYKDATELREMYEAEKVKRFEQPESEEQSTKTTNKRAARKEANLSMSEVKEEDDDKDENDTDKGPTRRKMARNVKASPMKGKPGRRKTIDNLNESINSSASTETGKTKRTSQAKCADLNIYLEDYFDAICSYQDGTQRYIANVFYLLPTAKDYPDYYETIKNPIDMKQIARKIMISEYNSAKSMEADLFLMIDNAKRYNEPKSIIYKDACKLRVVARDLCKQTNTLIGQSKYLPSSKTREKKLKLMEEIAQTEQEEFQQQLEKNFARSQNKAQPVQADHDEEDDEDEEVSDEEVDDEAKHTIKLESIDITDRKLGRPSSKTNPEQRDLIKSMWSVFDYLKEFTSGEHVLITPFVKLPSKTLYPDYYEDIKKPMALNSIKKKLNKRLYHSAREFFDEFELIFRNAMQYNVEESLIFKDAKLLLDELTKKRNDFPMQIDTIMQVPEVKSSPKNTPSKLKSKKLILASPTITIKPPNLSTSIPKFNDLKDKLVFLYTYINTYQHEERDLAPPFRLLPSKAEYPDYYNVIKKPIDMNKIWNKINGIKVNEMYASVDDMCLDFALMIENACTYNEPYSVIYKDALMLERALFIKRDELAQVNLITTSANTFNKDPINEFHSEIDFIKKNGYITNDFIGNAIQTLLEYLFQQCMQFEDMEGRRLSESFLDLYNNVENQTENLSSKVLTFNLVKEKLNAKMYKRMDSFQDDIFQVFNQIRTYSYSGEPNPDTPSSEIKIHRFSQLYRDAYDLQRYFIQKRDEVCSNGELLQTGALSFKYNSLDQYLTALSQAPALQNVDEAEILSVGQRYKPLESQLESPTASAHAVCDYEVGSFYYIDRSLAKSQLTGHFTQNELNQDNTKPLIACILAVNTAKTKLILQIYLSPHDVEFISTQSRNTRRYFEQEVFKSDLYISTESSTIQGLKPCVVIGIKEFVSTEHVLSQEQPTTLTNSDIFVCESIYSTYYEFFRKITAKKWSPLSFVKGPTVISPQLQQITLVKRPMPLLIKRQFLNEHHVQDLMGRVDVKLASVKFCSMHCVTVAYDSAPAAALAHQKEKGDDDYEMSNEEDVELMKKATYYEQVVYKDGDLYKLGDYVYAKSDKNSNNMTNETEKLPMIVRIDRLWSIPKELTGDNTLVTEQANMNFFLRGALFLRPNDVQHEPTRLFYKNEVVKEISREVTISLDQITFNTLTNAKKCSVMNSKSYVSSRLTEIDERDSFICESKYSLQLKTFRKFTKGLKKFELSIKCNEDEVYFLRQEIQIHKTISPFLSNLVIDYDEQASVFDPTSQADGHESNDEEWSDSGEPNLHDENSSHSFISSRVNENSNMDVTASPLTASILNKIKQPKINTPGSVNKNGKKIRVKRLKKCGYNIFSKEFRKSLRDTKSSLSFIDMSKEVGNRWRKLTEQQRLDYEEKAKRETIIEAQKLEAERQAQHQAQQAQAQSLNQNTTGYMNQQNVMVLSPQPAGAQSIQMVNNQMYLSPNANIINTANQGQVVYMNQQQTGQRQVSNQYVINNPAELQASRQENIGPKQVLHKEAYIRYISNMRKMQQYHSQPQSNVAPPITIMSDWHTGLDIRSSSIKESKVSQPPSAWIENVPSSDVMQHLLSLRYSLLNDAVNIKQSIEYSSQVEVPEETEAGSKFFAQLETCQDL